MPPNPFAVEALQALKSFAGPLPHTVNFYRQQELPFGVFSNFFPAKITFGGTEFLTSEHYFQAMKFATTDQQAFNDVVNATTPGDAAAVGRDRSRPLRPDWEQVKDDIMFDAITAKFLQHLELLQILMTTKGSKLVEQARNDFYWGVGSDGSGKNMLGVLLMKLRDTLDTAVGEENLKRDRSMLNEIIREKGQNPLRGVGSGAVATTTTNNVESKNRQVRATTEQSNANNLDDNNDDGEDEPVRPTAAGGGAGSSCAPQKTRNRLQ